jgi:hypothetical protein
MAKFPYANQTGNSCRHNREFLASAYGVNREFRNSSNRPFVTLFVSPRRDAMIVLHVLYAEQRKTLARVTGAPCRPRTSFEKTLRIIFALPGQPGRAAMDIAALADAGIAQLRAGGCSRLGF